MFEKLRKEAKQKAFIKQERHTREDHGGFFMCHNGLNSLGSLKILNGLRYRE